MSAAKGNDTVSAWTSSFSDCFAWSCVAGPTPVSWSVRSDGRWISARKSSIASTASSSVMFSRTTTYADVPSLLMKRSSCVSAYPIDESTRSSSRRSASEFAMVVWNPVDRASSPALPRYTATIEPPPAPNSSARRSVTTAEFRIRIRPATRTQCPGDPGCEHRRGDGDRDRQRERWDDGSGRRTLPRH